LSFGSSSTVDFHVRREPVIIVPGIMGSRLNRVSDGEEVWPNISRMIDPFTPSDSYLDDTILNLDGAEFFGGELSADSVIRVATGTILGTVSVQRSVYENIFKFLENDGYVSGLSLFESAYDWRLDLASSSRRFGETLEVALQNSPTGKVNIVAHSMGGLFVKKYLSEISDTSFINKLIIAGSPQAGSPKAIEILHYGSNLDFTWGPLEFLNPDAVKRITQNMPGVYELLPSRRYVMANGGYVEDFRSGGPMSALTYDATKEFMTENPSDSRNSGSAAA